MKALRIFNRLLASFPILFSALLFAGVNCLAQDVTAPMLHSVSLSTDTVYAGSSFVVTFEITDDVSGLAAKGNPSGPYSHQGSSAMVQRVGAMNWEFWIDTFTHVAGNFYQSVARISAHAQPGYYHVAHVLLFDVAGNNRTYYNSMDYTADFVVVTPNPDTVPPLLVSFDVLDTVRVPVPLFFRIEVIDTQSGLHAMNSTAYVRSPNGLQNRRVDNWTADGTPDKWKSILNWHQWMQGGTYYVDSIVLWDNAANRKTYYHGIDYAGDFFVIDSTPDFAPPEILSVVVSPPVVHRGDSISFLIEIRDTVAGLLTFYTSLTFCNSIGQQYQSISTWQHMGGDFYLGKTKVTEYAANGKWRVINLRAMDNALNYTSALPFPVTFDVVNDSIDLVTGRLLTSTGAPLANSRVFLIKQDVDNGNIYAMRRAFTDVLGYYQFNAERRDSIFYIKAIPDTSYHNELPTYCYSTTSFAQAQQFRLTGATTTAATFRTVSGTNPGGMGFISGQVSQGAGKRSGATPMAGLELVLATTQGDMLQFTITDSNGYFEFRNIPDGEYHVYPLQDEVDIDLSPVWVIDGNTSHNDIDFTYEETHLSTSVPNEEQQFAPVGAVWHYEKREMGPRIDYYKIEALKDTVLDSKNCRKLARSAVPDCNPFRQLHVYVYEEDSVTYFYNDSLQNFQVLYDLKAQQGDTWLSISRFMDNLDTLVVRVDSVYSQIINGVTLKTLNVIHLSTDSFVQNSTIIIERIGDMNYLFNMYVPPFCDGAYSEGLRCFEDTVLGFYDTGLSSSCEYVEVGIDETQQAHLTLYPNPAHAKLFIRFTNEQPEQLQVFDAYGREQEIKYVVEDNLLGMELTRFLPGVYFVKATMRSGSVEVKKFMVE